MERLKYLFSHMKVEKEGSSYWKEVGKYFDYGY